MIHPVISIKRSWWGRILAEHDTEPAEFRGALLKLLMGFWLVLPLDSFQSSRTFATLSFMPEFVWGWLFLILGALKLYYLRQGSWKSRGTMAFIGFLVWFSLGLVFVSTNPPALGWIMFMLAAAEQGWCCIRLRLHAREEEAAR